MICLMGSGGLYRWQQNGAMPENRIRPLRKAKGLTLERLADAAQVSTSYLSRLEAGERVLSVEVAERLAMALQTSAAEVLGLDAREPAVAPSAGAFNDDIVAYDPGPGDPFAALAGENRYLMQAKSDCLDLLGIRWGDILVVDGSAAICSNPPPLAAVRVQYHPDPDKPLDAITLLRQFVPPQIVITNSSKVRALALDLVKDDAQVLGVVVSTHRKLG